MERSKQIKLIKFEIETNKQRLNYALASGNVSLANRMLTLLAQLKDEYYRLTKGDVVQTVPTIQFFLVFSEEHMDGKRMSAIEYRAFTKRLSKTNRADLETHIAVEIESGMETEVDQAIFVEPTSQKKTA